MVRRVAPQDKSGSQKTTCRTQEKRDSTSAWESLQRGGDPGGGILQAESVEFLVRLATGTAGVGERGKSRKTLRFLSLPTGWLETGGEGGLECSENVRKAY